MTFSRARCLATAVNLAFGLGLPGTAAGQTVVGNAREPDGQPVPFVAVLAVDSTGTVQVRRLSDERGRFVLQLGSAGRWTFRFERLGFGTAERVLVVESGDSLEVDVEIEASPLLVEGVTAEVGPRCPTARPREETARLWMHMREVLEQLDGPSSPVDSEFTLRISRRDFWVREGAENLASKEEEVRQVIGSAPLYSAEPELLVEHGFMHGDGEELTFYAPDAKVLLSDTFLESHCFRVVRGSDGATGLAFAPAIRHQDRVGVEGTLWVPSPRTDSARIDFRWNSYPWELWEVLGSWPSIETRVVDAEAEFGGAVTLRNIAGVGWIVSAWKMRWPVPHQLVTDQSYLEPGWYLGLIREWSAWLEVPWK